MLITQKYMAISQYIYNYKKYSQKVLIIDMKLRHVL